MADSQDIEAENLRKVTRSKWEDQIKAFEGRGGKFELSIVAIENNNPIGGPFTFEPTRYTQNKTESNTNNTHVGSAVHQSVDSNNISTVYAFNDFYENIKHSNKKALANKIAGIQRLNEAKKEAEYHRHKRLRASSPPPSLPAPTADDSLPTADASLPPADAGTSRSARFWGS